MGIGTGTGIWGLEWGLGLRFGTGTGILEGDLYSDSWSNLDDEGVVAAGEGVRLLVGQHKADLPHV